MERSARGAKTRGPPRSAACPGRSPERGEGPLALAGAEWEDRERERWGGVLFCPVTDCAGTSCPQAAPQQEQGQTAVSITQSGQEEEGKVPIALQVQAPSSQQESQQEQVRVRGPRRREPFTVRSPFTTGMF